MKSELHPGHRGFHPGPFLDPGPHLGSHVTVRGHVALGSSGLGRVSGDPDGCEDWSVFCRLSLYWGLSDGFLVRGLGGRPHAVGEVPFLSHPNERARCHHDFLRMTLTWVPGLRGTSRLLCREATSSAGGCHCAWLHLGGGGSVPSLGLGGGRTSARHPPSLARPLTRTTADPWGFISHVGLQSITEWFCG